MKKRLFAILLTLCLLAQLLPLTANAVRAPAPHPSAHCVCGGNHQNINGHTAEEVVYFTKDGKDNASGDISNMNAIQSEAEFRTINNNSINNKGKTFYYYLANDVTIINQVNIGDDCTVVLCLHGHTLTCNIFNKDRAFNLWDNARLVITDCQYTGDRGLITGDCCGAVYVPSSSTLDLYGVSICMTSTETDGIRDVYNTPVCGVYNCGTFNMYGGCYYVKSDLYPTDRPVISSIRNTKYGPGVINRGTFNMYDGIISGNERSGVMSTITTSDDTVNLYGGTITGNIGAGISATHWPMPSIAESDYYTNVNLYGGTISENTGAGIDAAYGRVTMAQQSSAIPAEIKNNKGGAILLTRDDSTAKLGTGTITGNSGGKGAVALTAGSLTLTGDVNITGNTGANLYLASGKTVTLDNLGSSAKIGLTTENTAVPVVFAEANGTNYASRFTPDIEGYGIGYNAAKQLQLQNKAYTVTYNPGANGTGDSKTANKEHNTVLTLEGALFTRLGYTQVGWSKVDGGEKDYDLEAVYEQNAELTLYPVWQERSDYTVHIVNRDGSTLADFENVKWTDEIWKLLTPRPTRENDERLQALLLGTRRVIGGNTYGTFATGGEDSLTFVAVWDGTFANRGTISVGDSQWTGFRSEGTEHFFNEDQIVRISTAHPEELLYFRYTVSDQFFENTDAAAIKLKNDFVDYTETFSTASLNLEEGKPYVIYGYLFTEANREVVINTEKIIIDKTAPAITGAKDGDVFCGEGDKTLTVTDLYLDTVTVNGTAVTPNEQGEITLTDAREPQTVVATDKAGNSATLTVTVHSSHSYNWQTENGQYWGECEFCGNKVEKKDIPALTVTCPDAVCRTQDFTFSFVLPEGCTNPAYAYEFIGAGDGEPVTAVDGLCAGTIPADSYIKEENSFRFIASVTTAEGYRVRVSKDITIREHSGGEATCTAQAVCENCGQSYGELKAHTFTAETAEEQYLKTAATCTEKAVYYKSCAVCGATSKGTSDEAAFESGDVLGHNWGNWTPDEEEGMHKRVCANDATHIEYDYCTYDGWTIGRYDHRHVCTVCGAETDVSNHSDQDNDHLCDVCGKQITEHDFTGEIAITARLCTGANCLSPATYYKSCKICMLSSKGTDSEATFESGEKDPNNHAEEPGGWQFDGNSHWRVYTCCLLEVDRGAHQGGTADCMAPALCEVCDQNYGELGPHHFVNQLNEFRLKSAATCTSPAVYYQSCSTCAAQGTGTFENGEPLGHDYGAWVSNNNGTHTHVCSRDASHTETESCHGGTATCTKQAVCDDCGTAYGELAAHSFTAEATEEQYLKTAATCTEKAVYYKSCAACGLTSEGTTDEATFESGDVLGHDYGDWTSNGDGTHTHVCSRDASHTETENCHGGTATCTKQAVCDDCKTAYGELAAHGFTAETVEEQYLKTAATCTEKAVYYKSCAACGLTSEGTTDEATFESGDVLGHDYGAWVSNNNSTHAHVCSRDASHTETENCHGGTATCTKQAVCDDCGTAYGEPAAHGFTAETVEETYLKSAATCTEKAVYYKSCASCGLTSKGTADEATFESGDVLGHDYGAWTSNNNGTHTRVCSRDASHTETENCHGGTATCTKQAVCDDCKTAYGALDAERHAAGCVPEWVRTETTHTQKYSLCGKVTVAEAAHTYGDWEIIQASTAGERGEREHVCTVCAYKQTEAIPATGGFVDVIEDSYYEDAVIWAAGEGITNGTDATHFSPDAFCTRAQAVTFLWRAAGRPAPKSTAMPFTDVPVGSYYYDAVLWASENGITLGTSATTFSPDMSCSRAHIVTFLWRAENTPRSDSDNPFTDVDLTAYYAEAVLWAAAENITKGTSDTTFSPDDGCTRAQIVTFIWRTRTDKKG